MMKITAVQIQIKKMKKIKIQKWKKVKVGGTWEEDRMKLMHSHPNMCRHSFSLRISWGKLLWILLEWKLILMKILFSSKVPLILHIQDQIAEKINLLQIKSQMKHTQLIRSKFIHFHTRLHFPKMTQFLFKDAEIAELDYGQVREYYLLKNWSWGKEIKRDQLLKMIHPTLM